jgi:small-conductance mechanosensitive channel
VAGHLRRHDASSGPDRPVAGGRVRRLARARRHDLFTGALAMIESARTMLDGWGTALAILLAGALAGWLARTLLFRHLRALSRRTATRADDLLLDATRGAWFPAAVLLAADVALRFAPLQPERRMLAERVALAGLLLTVTIAAARFAGLWFAGTGEPGPAGRPSLIQKAARATVLVAGLLLVLDNAGIEIKTLLTALGVGSLAVGLALQPTLSNFFAGLHLSMSRPIRVGDFVELEDGTQGHVEDIGWRATKIRQLANNLAIVPNGRLADMRILNYSLPDLEQSVIVPVGVAYGSDLGRVEAVVVDVARAVQREVPEALKTHEPFVRFHTFNDSSIDFNVILRANAYTDRWPLMHEFVKRLKRRFDQEGIEIPFPQRVVHRPGGE